MLSVRAYILWLTYVLACQLVICLSYFVDATVHWTVLMSSLN